ncbi:hypothetical protein ALP75_201270 [Pseudomonas syringae pv. actinidiae]|nr:hypothetical protein ALP75_201270 [Pseudomonas syringae pv. actinidiae]
MLRYKLLRICGSEQGYLVIIILLSIWYIFIDRYFIFRIQLPTLLIEVLINRQHFFKSRPVLLSLASTGQLLGKTILE